MSFYRLPFLFAFLVSTCVLQADNPAVPPVLERTVPAQYIDLKRLGYEQYQDIIINNKVVQKASGQHNACDMRYKIIQKVLKRYKRPITMLDIGASQGYYSFRAAHDFQGAFVMIEGNNAHYPLVGTQLRDLCEANDKLNNIVLLNKVVVPEDLEKLSECEHFDVVLALNIIHWLKQDWKRGADAILNMGQLAIIETPPQERGSTAADNAQKKEIEDYLLTRGAKPIAKVPRHTSKAMATIYLFEGNKRFLQKKTWASPTLLDNTHEITCTYEKKKLTKPTFGMFGKYTATKWIPGINLLTFKMYHGSWPTKETNKRALETIRDISHNDWSINNMIIKGKRVSLIDYYDPEHNPGCPGGVRVCGDRVFAKHCELIDIDDPVLVKDYFEHVLRQE